MYGTKILACLSVLFVCCAPGERPDFQDGDIIFHESQSSQSEALRRAMKSPYTHMGVIFVEDGEPLVLEAVGPVKRSRLEDWIRRGKGGRFVVKRLTEANRLLTRSAIARLKEAGEGYAGLPYDPYFEWSDDRIYCSELVWKMYRSALNLEIGTLQKFDDFDLSDPMVARELKERFSNGIPTDETVISPASIFKSEQLVTVYER